MGEPIPSTGFASSQIRRAHQDGVKTPLTMSRVDELLPFAYPQAAANRAAA